MSRRAVRAAAVAYGALTHAAFAAAIACMAWALYHGLHGGPFDARGARPSLALALPVDALLIAQFPLLHSWLLGARGRALLARAFPAPHGAQLATTTFALVASLQLLLVFGAWIPLGPELARASGGWLGASQVAYAASFALLAKAIHDAGMGLQTGYIGWSAVAAGRKPRYPAMPSGGLFRACRQPIYLGFALTLWTGPVISVDRLALALPWTAYCVFGPRLKERRFARWYGAAWSDYRARTPYMLPVRWP
ncbi:MAG: isoprenylcysteine carboxylmethyltransferase family protein [Planctomycetota bacterium]|nr:MAG: isoprenylcysteine carboxylmethyltransferase family protein [Planctomycetota bacterium]